MNELLMNSTRLIKYQLQATAKRNVKLITFLFVFTLTAISFNTVNIFRLTGAGDTIMSSSSTTVFTTTTLPSDERLMATIGNGYLATTVFSDTVYVSGVYNGRRREPSHRARIPSTGAIRWSIPDPKYQIKSTEYSLDVSQGMFHQESVGETFRVRETVYAHRRDKHLLIVEIKVENSDNDLPLTLKLTSNKGNVSEDMKSSSVPKSKVPSEISSQAEAAYDVIRTSETEQSSRVAVAVVSSIVPENVTVDARTNKTYFFITAIVTSLDSVDYLQSAFKVFQEALKNVEDLSTSHVQEWAAIWSRASIEVEGDLKLAQAVSGSLYYILSSVRESWPYGLSPGSLSSNDYWGHSFWDTETWMYPTLLMLHPDIARGLLLYRYRRMEEARVNAKNHSVKGTMFPWESAFTGCPVCPEEVYSNYEIHVNGDIGFAVEQYWMATQDADWLREVGVPLIRGLAEFWASRVIYDAENNDYVINGVMCPDEYHSNVNNSIFTNVVAKRNLEFALKVVPEAPTTWLDIAQRMRIPFDTSHQYHPEYDGYTLNVTVKQADVILLGYPLMFNMSPQIRENDLAIYEPRTDPDGPAMTKAMFAVGWLELGNLANASTSFCQSHQNVREPFKVWTEYPSGDGAVNFLTGMGGFLQAILFGYGGLRLHPEELRMNPKLPDNATKVLIRGIHYRGSVLDVAIGSAETEVVVTSSEVTARILVLSLIDKEQKFTLNVGKRVTFRNGPVVIRTENETVLS